MLIVVGSRREGNSYNLAKNIQQKLDLQRIHCEIIVPGNQRIHLCTGCMDCDKNGICDFTDDMKNNIDKIITEEYIMFISPARWNLLSGDLKIFIDRLNPLYSTGKLKGKKFIAVAIGSKGKEKYSTEFVINSLTSFAESAGMDVIFDKEFNNCLNTKDILHYDNEVNQFIDDVVAKISQ